MTVHRFEAPLQRGRGGGAFVEIPPEVLEELGSTRVPVRGAVQGHAFRGSTMPIGGGRACVGVYKAVREAEGLAFDEPVRIEIEVDREAREVEVPEDLRKAFSHDARARAAFENLSYTHRKEYARWVADAKRDETRARRVAKALHMLRGGIKHP